MKTQNYSLNNLAGLISSINFESDTIELNKVTFDFYDASAMVDGKIIGYFDVQKETMEDPPFCDLKYVWVEITSVLVNSESFEKIFTIEEKRKLEEQIKYFMV